MSTTALAQSIKRADVQALLDSFEDGRIFGVEFIKRSTGETRKMTCRRHVTKGVKCVGTTYDPKEKNLLMVYDMRKSCFKTIPLENIMIINGLEVTD